MPKTPPLALTWRIPFDSISGLAWLSALQGDVRGGGRSPRAEIGIETTPARRCGKGEQSGQSFRCTKKSPAIRPILKDLLAAWKDLSPLRLPVPTDSHRASRVLQHQLGDSSYWRLPKGGVVFTVAQRALATFAEGCRPRIAMLAVLLYSSEGPSCLLVSHDVSAWSGLFRQRVVAVSGEEAAVGAVRNRCFRNCIAGCVCLRRAHVSYSVHQVLMMSNMLSIAVVQAFSSARMTFVLKSANASNCHGDVHFLALLVAHVSSEAQ